MQLDGLRQFQVVEFHRTLRVLVVCAILVLAVALRLYGIDRGLYYDELATAYYFVETGSFIKIASTSIVFNNHIAYSILAFVAQELMGRHEWVLRLPALLFGLGSLIFFWQFARRWLNEWLALGAMLLLAFSPSHVVWSQSARGYTALVFFTLCSSFLFLELLVKPSRRNALLFVLASVTGIYFHLYASVVTAVQILFVIYLVIGPKLAPKWTRRLTFDTRATRMLALAFVAIIALALLLYAPVLRSFLTSMRIRGQGAFEPFFPLNVIEELSGSRLFPTSTVLLVIFFIGWVSFYRTNRTQAFYFGLLFVVPLGALWLAHPTDLYTRFFVFLLPYYLFLVTLGLTRILAWRARIRAK